MAFLERLKEALHMFTNEGQMTLKIKFLSQSASDIRIKLQKLQQQDLVAPVDEMVQTATNAFYNQEEEREANAQKKEKRKETRHARLPATFQGCSTANPSPRSLEDKAQINA